MIYLIIKVDLKLRKFEEKYGIDIYEGNSAYLKKFICEMEN